MDPLGKVQGQEVRALGLGSFWFSLGLCSRLQEKKVFKQTKGLSSLAQKRLTFSKMVGVYKPQKLKA